MRRNTGLSRLVTPQATTRPDSEIVLSPGQPSVAAAFYGTGWLQRQRAAARQTRKSRRRFRAVRVSIPLEHSAASRSLDRFFWTAIAARPAPRREMRPPRLLLRLDVVILGDLGPLLDLVRHERLELCRRSARRQYAALLERGASRGIVQRLVECRVELRHDVIGCRFWRDDSERRSSRREIKPLLLQRRNVRLHREPLIPRISQHPNLAGRLALAGRTIGVDQQD